MEAVITSLEGKDGAVAGYSAVQSGAMNLAGHTSPVQIPGLSKALPAGSFIVSANLEINANSPTEAGTAGIQCELVDTPSSGASAAQVGGWVSAVDVKVLGG